MRKINAAIILNLIIFVLMVVGAFFAFTGLKFDMTRVNTTFWYVIKFFTVQSNIFMGIAALLYAINEILHLKKGIELNRTLFIIKYIATICVTITFFTVALFLAPVFYKDNYFALFYDTNFLFHLVIPVLSMIIFIFLENRSDMNIKITFLGIVPYIVYSIFYVILAITHMENGKVVDGYDWYGFLYFGIPTFILLTFIMIVATYLLSFLLYFLNKKLYK